jgi:hypothetical protein
MSQHDVVCCRACLSDSHRSCESALPLDSASKDVKNSSLLSDTLEEQDYMTGLLKSMLIDKCHVFLCLFSPRVFPVQPLLR